MGIVTDLSVNVAWNVASGYKNTFTITATLNGSAYSLASRAFSLQIRKIGSESNFINLTEGSGITNAGASGILTIVLTAAQAATLGNDNYFYQLTCITDETRWINGTINSTTGTYTGELATELTAEISLTGTAVTLELVLGGGGGSERYRGEVSVATNLFPETGGTNDMRSGRPFRGDWFLFTTGGTLKDRSEASIDVPAGSMGFYTGADDGNMQLGANWKINQG